MSAPGAPAATPRESHDPGPPSPAGASLRGRRAVRLALFLLGLAILTSILVAVGWRSVAANLGLIGGWFFGLAALYGLAQLSFALGWWVLTGPAPRAISFRELFAAYLGGDAINYVTTVVGEPVKAQLLKGRIGFSRAFATVAVHRHAEILAQWLFLSLGVAIALMRFPLNEAARALALGGLAFLGGLLLWLTWGLRRGAFRPALAWIGRFRPLSRRAARLEESARILDSRIGEFYGADRHRFWSAVAWCFLGWCGGLAETYLVLRLLAPGEGWATAVAVESLSMVLNTILLFIPARVGTAEGIRAAVFVLVGLTAAQGVAAGLLRRARELLWTVPGFVILLQRHVLGSARDNPPEARLNEEPVR